MTAAKFTDPSTTRYFEDYIAGSEHELGRIAVDEAEVIAFAERYDPQPFHTDPEAGRQSIYGGLIASGWMTGSLMMSLIARHYLSPVTSLGSPGVDDLRWRLPVRPGDQLAVRVAITKTRRSRSKPDRGLVHTTFTVLNQRDEVVMDLRGVNLILCRAAA